METRKNKITTTLTKARKKISNNILSVLSVFSAIAPALPYLRASCPNLWFKNNPYGPHNQTAAPASHHRKHQEQPKTFVIFVYFVVHSFAA
jgi:hypothetical protein